MSFGSGGLGEVPYGGGVGVFDTRSVGDPLPGLISDPQARRVFLLRATPGGGLVDVGSEGVFADGKLFPSALPQPHNFAVSLPLPSDRQESLGRILAGGTVIGVSDLVISNPSGHLDAVAALDWLGADAPVYLGPRGAGPDAQSVDFTEYTRIFAGIAKGVEYNPDRLRLLMRDFRFRLEQRLETERYMGTGPCLRFDGSGDRVDYGDVLDKEASDSFSVEILFRSTATGTNQTFAGKKQSTSASHPGWRFNFSAADVLTFNISDGTTSVAATVAGGAWLDGKLHRATAICNRTTQALLLYVDGVFVAASGSIASVGSLANSIPLQVGAINSTLVFNGDLDDFRMWNGVLSGAAIADAAHRELLGSESGLDLYSQFNEGLGSTTADASGNGKAGTITGATWVGSLEGDAAIAGQPKPRAYGLRRQVSPRLVDAQRLVYQVHNGSMQAISAVRDKGDPLTFGSDVADIYSSIPAPGTYNTCKAKGLFRLGSTPVGEVTVDLEGDNGGSLGYKFHAPGIAQKILLERAGLIDPDALDTVAFTALSAEQPAVVGYYLDEDINLDEALDEVMGGAGCWWGPTRTGQITVGRINDPETLTPTVTWSLDDDLIELVDVRPFVLRVREVRASYRPYHRTLNADQVAGAVPAATRDDFGKEVRWATARATNYTSLPDDAATIEIDTSFDNRADARAEAVRLAEWLSKITRVYVLKPEAGTLAYYIGTVGNLTGDRYDLTGGRKMVVIGVTENVGTNTEADSLEVVAVGQ